jgi:RNA-binding protein YhbY
MIQVPQTALSQQTAENWVGQSVSQIGKTSLSARALKEIDQALSQHKNIKLVIMDNQSVLTPNMVKQIAQAARADSGQVNLSAVTGLEDSFVVVLQLGRTIETSRVSLVTSAHHKQIDIQPSAQEVLDQIDRLLSSAATRGRLESIIPRAIEQTLVVTTQKAENQYSATMTKINSSLELAQLACNKLLKDLTATVETYPEFAEPIQAKLLPAVTKLKQELEQSAEQVPCLEIKDAKQFLLQSEGYFDRIHELRNDVISSSTFLKNLETSQAFFEKVTNSWVNKGADSLIGQQLTMAQQRREEVICSWHEHANSSQATIELAKSEKNLSDAYALQTVLSSGQVLLAGITALMLVIKASNAVKKTIAGVVNRQQQERELSQRLIRAESEVQELGLKLIENSPALPGQNIFDEHRPFWKRLFQLEREISHEKRNSQPQSANNKPSKQAVITKLSETESELKKMSAEVEQILNSRSS